MFTVVYTKKDGRVQGISSGTYSDEDFLEAYGEDYAKLETEELLYTTPYRQYLAVEEGKLIVKDEELSAEKEKFVRQMEIADEMNTLKNYLSDTDYTVIKCTETGVNFAETYPEVATKRASARTRINELEEELKTVDMTSNQ